MKCLKSLFWRLLFIISLCSPSLVRGQVDTLFRYAPDERIFKLWQNPAWDAIWAKRVTAKDSVRLFAQLRQLQTFANRENDDRLYWYAELHKILFRHHLVDFSGQFSTVLDEAEPLMDQCPVPVVRASLLYFRGRYYFGELQFEKGFRLLLQAQQEFERIGYQNIPEINQYLVGLGGRYYFFEEYKVFLRYMDQAFRYPFLSRRAEVSALHSVGMAHQQLKDFAKAAAIFSQAIRKARVYRDTTFWGIASVSYGQNLLELNQTKQALPHLYTGSKLSRRESPEHAATAAIHIAKALLALNRIAEAKAYIEESRTLKLRKEAWVEYPLVYYQVQALYYRKTGDFPKATLYLDSTIQVKDSQRALFSNQLLNNTQIRINAERYLSSLQALDAEKANAILVRNIIIVALVLLTAAGVYALSQNQLKRRREKQVQTEQQKRAEELLAHATAQLNQHMTYLKEKNELIEKLAADLAQATPSEASSARSETHVPVEDLLQRTLITEADWQRFKRLFEQVHPGFLDSLQDKYPELTTAEVRLLTLSKLEIPSKDMGFILGVSQDSVRKARYRLRRKLEQRHPDTTLESLIRSL
ncbi:helix-turn-helix transcriptional regulator [Rudanella lutea]|uniref:helix-turn-helix transcriptional regulator n=1 Tax=Rudanella lutea TaxID=451374 RepID=UPI00035DD5B6|nr:hypothetical protein [Rudanella lutea]